MTVMRLSDIYH